MIDIKRTNEIRYIVNQTVSAVSGDLEFAEVIAKREDLTLIEKIFAGCIVREFIKDY